MTLFDQDISLHAYRSQIADYDPLITYGRVSEMVGLVLSVRGLQAERGELCTVHVNPGSKPRLAEVVGF